MLDGGFQEGSENNPRLPDRIDSLKLVTRLKRFSMVPFGLSWRTLQATDPSREAETRENLQTSATLPVASIIALRHWQRLRSGLHRLTRYYQSVGDAESSRPVHCNTFFRAGELAITDYLIQSP